MDRVKRSSLYILVGIAGLGALSYWRRADIGAGIVEAANMAEEWLYSLAPENRANRDRWAAVVAAAEVANGLPATLLDRLIWRESRYRTDIITGAFKSSAGAVGIAQFMPATAARFGVDPLNPDSALPGAARYLRTLYNEFGDWRLAVAGYNAGEGNVRKYAPGLPPFAETRAYVAEIVDSHGGFA